MISCIIADDEYLAIKIMEAYLAHQPDINILQTFTDSKKALAAINEAMPDLLILDIHMPWLNGIELIRQLSYKPLIIFCTAHPDFAATAYELNVIDYLVKPVAQERFIQALEKVRDYKQFKLLKKDTTPLLDYTMVKANHKIIRVNFADIIYIEGLNEYIKIHTTQKSLVVLAALKDWELQLPRQTFCRVHKSFIINSVYLSSIQGMAVTLADGKELPIGRAYKKNMKDFTKGIRKK